MVVVVVEVPPVCRKSENSLTLKPRPLMLAHHHHSTAVFFNKFVNEIFGNLFFGRLQLRRHLFSK